MICRCCCEKYFHRHSTTTCSKMIMNSSSLLVLFWLQQFVGTNAFTVDPSEAYKECTAHGRKQIICAGTVVPLLPPRFHPLITEMLITKIPFRACPIDDESLTPDSPIFKNIPIIYSISYGQKFDVTPCMYCPPEGSDCESAVENLLAEEIAKNSKETFTEEDTEQFLAFCKEQCEAGEVGEVCASGAVSVVQAAYGVGSTYGTNCLVDGSTFCDFSDPANESGICKACPVDLVDCFKEGLSEEGLHHCRECKGDYFEIAEVSFTVGGEQIDADFFKWAKQEQYQSAQGTLVDCPDLIHDNGGCSNAAGNICLVKYSFGAHSFNTSNNAEKSGCSAIVMYSDAPYIPPDKAFCGVHHLDHLAIPFICVSLNDGLQLKENDTAEASIIVQILGIERTENIPREIRGSGSAFTGLLCSDDMPCGAGEWCAYEFFATNGKWDYEKGLCQQCPIHPTTGEPFPRLCYGISSSEFSSEIHPPQPDIETMKSCAKACNAGITFDANCKFCPAAEIATDPFAQVVENVEDKCSFCPNNDMQYPRREIQFLGEPTRCDNVNRALINLPLHKDTQVCRLAQSYNYICGCSGTGYGGASTLSKQAALAWAPRVAAIMSIFGSSFIIWHATRAARWKKTVNQLLVCLSVFDLFGSLAYAFTTLPTPSSEYMYGAAGNQATCTAQGFFIQIGTTTCFLNTTLAVYYHLTISLGWSEDKLRRKKWFLFLPPILIGLVFAFAGIPYYANLILWCNNSAKWWPEIPVIMSIIAATVIMASVSLGVYRKEKKSSRYSGGTTPRRGVERAPRARRLSKIVSQKSLWLSKLVREQSFWILASFYITWIPYVVLQYVWSSGNAYGNYGFILFAGITVPLQGFWNFMVYIRPRFLQEPKKTKRESKLSRRLSSFMSSLNSRMSSSSRRRSDVCRGSRASSATVRTSTTRLSTGSAMAKVIRQNFGNEEEDEEEGNVPEVKDTSAASVGVGAIAEEEMTEGQ